MNEARVSTAATVAIGAQLSKGVCIHGTASVGANVTMNGRISVLGQAQIDNVTVEGDCITFSGDALVESENDWFTDLDSDAPHMWVLYKTTRTWEDGSPVWQVCAGCVHALDVHSGMDFTDTTIYVDSADHAPARDIQRDRILVEIDRRNNLEE